MYSGLPPRPCRKKFILIVQKGVTIRLLVKKCDQYDYSASATIKFAVIEFVAFSLRFPTRFPVTDDFHFGPRSRQYVRCIITM